MFDLSHFGMSEMVTLGSRLRGISRGQATMEGAAGAIVGELFDSLRGPDGAPALALARLYKTHPFGALPGPLQAATREKFPSQELGPQTRCLVLLATRGAEAAWNSRHTSAGHQVIPLLSADFIEQLPMVARVVRQFGLDVAALVASAPQMPMEGSDAFNVFHVAEAKGSPFIPAQADFVVAHTIASVLGFGAPLPDKNLFVGLVFSRVPIGRPTAEHFRTVALSVKLALLPFVDGALFAA